MENETFILTETSPYAPLNPDRSGQSVPINAHFEITIKRAQHSACAKKNETTARQAPTVTLSELTGGEFPLFGNGGEVAAFAASLILSDQNWSKNVTTGSDELRFTYNGGIRTLKEDFILSAYSDFFNSTAAWQGKAVIKITGRNFSQQFEDASDDNYTLTVTQVYAPVISSFVPKELTPVGEGKPDYLVPFGKEVLLTWAISGNSLKSPILTKNGGAPETVSPDTPVKRVICSPVIFCLSVESNAYPGVKNSRTITFGISTPPAITGFSADADFCLPGERMRLEWETAAARSVTITARNSSEEAIEVLATAKSAMAAPKLIRESDRRVVYTLTANGFKGSSPAFATASLTLFVSRWKKENLKMPVLPRHTEHDAVVRTFLFGGRIYCFSGQAVFCSSDGKEWSKLSELPLPQGAVVCKASSFLSDGQLYVVGGEKDHALYYAKYDLKSGTWSVPAVFGPAVSMAGGAFASMGDDRFYYFAAHNAGLACCRYSPEPFDCWGQVGQLELSAKALDTDCLVCGSVLYIAAACEDKHIYVYRATFDLDIAASPLKVEEESAWVRLLEVNGQICAAAQTGLFDVRTGEKKDMMFDKFPQLLGIAGGKILGISRDHEVWFSGLSCCEQEQEN